VDFRGHLRLPEDAGAGIPVELRLDDIFVIITSAGNELGAWRADDVVINRIFSNQFAIELDGESMVFIAQDALGFAYEGISAIEDLQERLTKRRAFKRSKKKKVEAPSEEAPAQATAPAPSEPAVDEDEEQHRRPQPIWSPPSITATPTPAPSHEPSVPEPIRELVEAEPSEPLDVRMSYPQPSVPPTPIAAESFVPPSSDADASTPAPRRVEPAPHSAPEPASRTVEPAAKSEPRSEPELEIEEVAAAATGATWLDDPAATEDVEIEIEDYVLPAAGLSDTYTAPFPAPAAAESGPAEVGAVDDAGGDEELGTPPAPSEAENFTRTRMWETAADEPGASQAAEVPTTPAVQSNGHGAVREFATDDDAPDRRVRRHSLFGRSRDKKVPPHEHRYGDPKTIGGLTRSVCEICGHVTFSGEDAYQGW